MKHFPSMVEFTVKGMDHSHLVKILLVWLFEASVLIIIGALLGLAIGAPDTWRVVALLIVFSLVAPMVKVSYTY